MEDIVPENILFQGEDATLDIATLHYSFPSDAISFPTYGFFLWSCLRLQAYAMDPSTTQTLKTPTERCINEIRRIMIFRY